MTSPFVIFWIYTSALLLLWIYIVSCFSKDVFFNLYVNRTRTLLFKPVTWVQSIAPKCTEWAAAAILLVFVLLLRCAVAKASGKPLFHSFGGYFGLEMKADLNSFPASALFSLVSFIIIVCQANLIRLALVLRFGKSAKIPVIECLDTVSTPLSIPAPIISAVATVICLLACTALMALSTAAMFPPAEVGGITLANPFGAEPLYAVKITLLALVDTLYIVKSGLMLLIFISIAGLLFRNMTVMGMANEWLGLFSRVFVKNPIGIGMLDFTPLILYYVLGFVHGFLVDLVNNLL